MTQEGRISDRHQRDIDGLALAANGKGLVVRVAADEVWSRSPAGQHLISCLINLLCRQTELVRHIDIAVGDADVLVPMPHRRHAGRLADALGALPAWAVGDEVTVSIDDRMCMADVTICIGPIACEMPTHVSLYGLADGWRVWIGSANHMPSLAAPPTSENPLGPFFAAAILAGEVFKRARGITRGRLIEEFSYSIWTGETGDWAALADGPSLSGRSLPPYYLVGAGAVGQALAYVVGSAGLSEAYVVTIDDDKHDRTNLNRCFLAGIEDIKNLKIEAVDRFLRLAGLRSLPFNGTISDYVARPKPELRADLAREEAAGRYATVISCVDKGKSRQDIQGLWPNLILGGSTERLTAKTNVYDLGLGSPCLGCHNPAEKDGDRLREVEKLVRTMSPEEQRAYIEKHVADPDAVLAYLASPACGTVGEQMFRQFATEQAREFSVSFVSMAAGVLLASRLFSRLLFDAADTERPRMTSLAFLNGMIGDASLAIDTSCPRCSEEARDRHRAEWG